ncbi:hypothetical protein M426DRAFT_321991 [Hypoxylon sp. CI-4A]|nr:hypothetical protein M426DRAFT_321991 [Hypoxylon sp. CI-4A]
MTSPTKPVIDHVVILVPHSFLSSPPDWFNELFKFQSGGRHADGLTENALVFLEDGSYLEFIAFVPDVDPAKRESHQWGSKREGTVIDWAVTLPSSAEDTKEGKEDEETKASRLEKEFHAVQKQVQDANTGIIYADLKRGGRTRPDNEVLKWATAFGKRNDKSEKESSESDGDGEALEPGTVPFWCLDVTPRHLRVPYLEPQNTEHPSGVVGVAKMEVFPGLQETVDSARGVYDTLLEQDAAEISASWKVGTLAGEKVHSNGIVQLNASDGPARIDISFFTNDPGLARTMVGGKVDEESSLTFRLVAAYEEE